MLQRQQLNLSDTRFHAFIYTNKSKARNPKVGNTVYDSGLWTSKFELIFSTAEDCLLSSAENPQPEDADAELEDAARSERHYVRERLREELKREPTEQEVDEWLRQHTEGY